VAQPSNPRCARSRSGLLIALGDPAVGLSVLRSALF
jgi:hypothetical protein